MDEAKLAIQVDMIAKLTFVIYHDLLADFSQTDQAVAELLSRKLSHPGKEITLQNALTWRVLPARKIIKAGQAKEAMLLISRSDSPRLSKQIKQKAAEIAEQLGDAE